MIDARFRPLPKWTETRPLRLSRSPFKKTYAKALDLLEFELGKLQARNIVIEAGFALPDIRNDGWPRSGAKPSHPGVILYFDGKNGAMRFPCGTYQSFENNLYAIALTLENLRAIDRYGVTMGHEQYQGFRQLAAPELSPEAAARTIEKRSGISYYSILESEAVFRAAEKQALYNTHSDRGGNVEHFQEVQQARRVLEGHFAAKAGGAS
jgi:hypothetical protein